MIARWASFLTVMLAATWLPQIILFLGLSMGDAAPVVYLATHWLDVPRFLLAGIVMAAYSTTLALLTASFTTRRAYASVFLVGLFDDQRALHSRPGRRDRRHRRTMDLDVEPRPTFPCT